MDGKKSEPFSSDVSLKYSVECLRNWTGFDTWELCENQEMERDGERKREGEQTDRQTNGRTDKQTDRDGTHHRLMFVDSISNGVN